MILSGRKELAFLLLVICIALLLVNSFLITSQTIDNSIPTSYIIVPILMLPLLAAFAFKHNPSVNVDKNDIEIGILVFGAFIVLNIALELAFPYTFFIYRIDMLTLPLGIIGIVMVLFNISAIEKFWEIIIYPVFASPSIFLPFLGLNDAFAKLNSFFVYSTLKLFSNAVTYMPPFSISTQNYTIGIGTACAGIAVFIALALFLLPIAYFFNGTNKNKIYWICCGLGLLVFFNFARMSAIAFVWLLYGPNFAVSFVHGFAGILLFYITIIAMVLLSGRFGLQIPKIKIEKPKGKKQNKLNFTSYLVVLVLCSAYILVSLNYLSQNIIPLNQVPSGAYNFTSKSLIMFGGNLTNARGWNITAMPQQGGLSGALVLTNKTFNATNPAVIVLTLQSNRTLESMLLNNTGKIVSYNFADSHLVTSTVYEISSNNTVFFVMSKTVPYLFQNNYYTKVRSYVIMPQKAGMLGATCNKYDGLYTYLENVFAMPSPAVLAMLNSAYCVGSNFV